MSPIEFAAVMLLTFAGSVTVVVISMCILAKDADNTIRSNMKWMLERRWKKGNK